LRDLGIDDDFIETIFLSILIIMDLINLKISKSIVNEWVIEDTSSYKNLL